MRVGLCLGGGGSLGAYQAGVLSMLSEWHPALSFDALSGTSAGAINAAALSQHKRLSDGAKFVHYAWTELLQGRRSVARLTVRGVSGVPLRNALKGALTQRPQVPCYLSATDMRTGNPVVFAPRSPAGLVRAVMASASHPAAFPVVRARGTFFADGGILTPFPTRAMSKVDVVIVVLCGPENLPDIKLRQLNTPVERLRRSYAVSQRAALKRSLSALREQSKVILIAPEQGLGSPADFSRATILSRIQVGRSIPTDKRLALSLALGSADGAA